MRKRQYVICAMMLALPLAGCGAFKGKGGPRTPTVGERVSILSNDNSIKVDPTTAEIAVVLPDPVLNADWAQSGGNASKSMGHPALGAARTKAWEASIAGSTKKQRLAAAPVISNNRLFAVDTDAVVSAFAADTGAKLWSVSIGSTGKDFENSLFGGGASVDGNVVYATSGVGDVAALNAEDGKLLWKVKPAGPLRGAPTVAFGGVYVITQDNQIFALNAGDGAVQWQATASLEPGSVFGAASPAAGQGTIVAGFSSGEVQAYRYENGRDLWEDALARTSMALSVSTLTDVDADPVIDRGRVFALGQGGRMASYDLLTGQRIWEISIAGISTPYVVGEWVYAMTDDGKLLCVARGSGKVRWIQQLARYRVETEKKKKDPIRWTGPILAGGRLIAVNSEGQLVEFSPTDGSTLATTEFKSPLSQPPVVANNRLYILADDGTITAWQ
ncbi:MAG: outer membrane protein assembly factor BamB family protein [Sphingopyxis terrae]|jgi:outer membrane protein assembly factor BamB|uniref:Pyrrolo-quinoline quinone n=1 Tax=Sphingopyxis terrae subsp. terrae NBRC 15098 TaxID=1219058 RepID=A0A142VW89_9SPHN|nr:MULTISPECIES: PQQ-binding-like beta-propeller repeat protein [Sphingopyxis]AMU93547.1 pyrrolo-quinoline quinone [Sphingopyxis terrae subsp. terrae NBRC 15098]KTE74952.1 pyrrolo-quinoline quinone [Sphingopyxis sp. A083]QXF13177.1 PQQ-binding-like beta-propeller repeat protein [Sphingopyxis terrae subsp. terrae]